MEEDLFYRGRCSHCYQMMTARAVSYFTDKMICLGCLEAETELKTRLRQCGVNPRRFEGCGHWPSVQAGQSAFHRTA